MLSREYGGELKYTKATDFLRHDGICWREEPQLALGAAEEFSDLQLQDAQDAVTNAMDALVAAGISEAVVKGGGKELEKSVPSGKMGLLFALVGAQTYLKFAMKYRNYKNIMNALNAARPMLAMYISDFDKDPNMLNTPLGTYDLAKGTGGMHPHNAEDYITKVTNYAPGDDGADIWKDAIELFFCGDAELIDYVQAMVGMAAVGKVYQEHMIIAYGGGANGKSTFWNAIFRVLGSYAGKISAEALTMNCKRNVKPEMAELKGKRLIIASELEEGTRLNTAMVKQLCSTDEIEAEKGFCQFDLMEKDYKTFYDAAMSAGVRFSCVSLDKIHPEGERLFTIFCSPDQADIVNRIIEINKLNGVKSAEYEQESAREVTPQEVEAMSEEELRQRNRAKNADFITQFMDEVQPHATPNPTTPAERGSAAPSEGLSTSTASGRQSVRERVEAIRQGAGKETLGQPSVAGSIPSRDDTARLFYEKNMHHLSTATREI